MPKRHILIVDDEPKLTFFLSRTLERSEESYHVSVANSGEEALELLRQSPIDLLITDLRMPGISGLELIRWVRASSPETRTILITAYGNDEVEAEARRLEAYRYITKPFDLGDFTEVVRGALNEFAFSGPGLVVLSDDAFEAIAKQMDSLRYDIGAMCIFLADMQGQRLVAVGNAQGLDDTTLLALLGGRFATSSELARRFGDGKSANLSFHEGSRYEIYSANVDDSLFLTIVYDCEVQTSRVGIVWMYTKRAIQKLQAILESARKAEPTSQSLDADFGACLTAEMDSAFADEWSSDPAQDTRTMVSDRSQQEERDPTESPRVEQASAHELLDMEAAIARGLIPSEWE